MVSYVAGGPEPIQPALVSGRDSPRTVIQENDFPLMMRMEVDMIPNQLQCLGGLHSLFSEMKLNMSSSRLTKASVLRFHQWNGFHDNSALLGTVWMPISTTVNILDFLYQ